MGIEDTPETYQDFIKQCMPQKNKEGLKPQEAMQACAIDYKQRTGQEPGNLPDLTGQLFLVSSEDCPSCEEAKIHFKEDIDQGTIQVVTIDDDEGWDIIRTLQLSEVPSLVLKSEGGYCPITPEGNVGKCVTPTRE